MGKWGAGLLILIAVAGVFGRAAKFEFTTFDDGLHVYENPLLQPPSVAHVARAWRSPYHGLYIPVTYTVWSVLAAAGGGTLEPHRFHLANLVLHAVNAILVFLILLRLSGVAWAALAGALLFAWHPVQVEPVAWITGFRDVLCGTFFFLALWLALVAKDSGRRKLEAAAFAAFVLALLSKPAAVVLPIMLVLIDSGAQGEAWHASLRRRLPWLLAAVPIMVLTKLAQPDKIVMYVTPWWGRPLVAIDAIVFYLSKLCFPLVLLLNYGRTPEVVLASPITRFLPLVPIAGLALIWRRSWRKPALVVLALFVAGVLPVLGFLPFTYQAYSTVADRFLYLAMIGPALGLTWWLSKGSKTGVIVVALALSWCAVKASAQLEFWKDNVALVSHLARWNAKDPALHYALGVVFQEASQPAGTPSHYARLLRLPPPPADPAARAKNFALAVREYEEAIRLDPKFAGAENNLGLLLAQRGAWKKAAEHFRRASALEPELAEPTNNLGVALAADGDVEGAISAFRRLLHRAPGNESARVNLGLALFEKQDWSAALAEFKATLAINPRNTIARAKLAELTKPGRH